MPIKFEVSNDWFEALADLRVPPREDPKCLFVFVEFKDNIPIADYPNNYEDGMILVRDLNAAITDLERFKDVLVQMCGEHLPPRKVE